MNKSIYLSARQLRDRFGGVSESWIDRRLKSDSTFPRPVKFGRLRFWKIEAIEKWERKRAAA